MARVPEVRTSNRRSPVQAERSCTTCRRSATSFVPGETAQTVTPGFNHGTHVSGIIAAAINNIGTQGVAPKAKIIPVKVLSELTGSGSFGGIIAGLEYVSNLNRSGIIHVDI